MEFLIIGLGFASGGLIGIIVSILFFRNDEHWKNIVTIILGLGVDGAFILFFFNCFDITTKLEKILLGFSMFLSIIIAFFIMAKIMSVLLKDQTGKNVLRMMDLFLGFKDALNDYYETRKNTIKLDVDKSLEEINDKEIMLTVIEKENNIKQSELKRLEKELHSCIGDVIKIPVPVDQNIIIDKNFVEDCVNYLDDYRSFKNQFITSSNNFNTNLANEIIGKNEGDIKEIKRIHFNSFLLSISQSIITYLFDNSLNVRVHFRVLIDDSYQKYYLYKNGEGENYRLMTPIPINETNLIITSFVHRSPIIKQMNEKYNFVTNKDNPYPNYLTIAFYKITKNISNSVKCGDFVLEKKLPLMSMTISIRDQNRYGNRLNMLLLTRFDREIHEQLEKLFRKFNIYEVL